VQSEDLQSSFKKQALGHFETSRKTPEKYYLFHNLAPKANRETDRGNLFGVGFKSSLT